MMRWFSKLRRTLLSGCLILLWAGGIGLCPAALAQPSVLVLSSRDNPVYRQVAASFEAFLQQEVGGLEFVSVTLDDDDATAQQRLAELQEKELALVFALGSQATTLAAKRFPKVSAVSSMVLSRADLKSLPNVTGVALEFPLSTQLRWMRRLLPEAKRIGVLYDPAQNQAWVDSAQRMAKKRGLKLIPIPVNHARELPAGLKKLDKAADVLWAIPDKTVYSNQTLKEVLLSSFRSRIPVVGLSGAWVKAGALYALDRDYQDLGRQTGVIAKKLLAGTSPRKVAPETPSQVVYSLNVKTARHMKANIGDKLLAGAVKVYE
jgi:putative ABC transport system substrate-binding protein